MHFFTRVLLAATLTIPAIATAQIDPALRPYTVCKFDDGLTVAEKSALPPGIKGRSVETIAGPRDVLLTRGERVMFSYPGHGFFANVKAEQLPAASFDDGKQTLIANFDHILAAGDDGERNMNYALHPMLNGFELYGLDRKKIEGKTLGIYLIIDNKTHVVTTAYFLNQEPASPKFTTLDEYANLRDHFLNAYTACVHAPHTAAPAKPKAAPTRHKRKR